MELPISSERSFPIPGMDNPHAQRQFKTDLLTHPAMSSSIPKQRNGDIDIDAILSDIDKRIAVANAIDFGDNRTSSTTEEKKASTQTRKAAKEIVADDEDSDSGGEEIKLVRKLVCLL